MGVIAELGDVFEVPIAAGTAGLGIVAAQGSSDLYLVVFDGQFEAGATPRDVEGLDPLLASSKDSWSTVASERCSTRITCEPPSAT